MKLVSQPLGAVNGSLVSNVSQIKSSPIQVIGLLTAHQNKLGQSVVDSYDHVHSTLLGGVGIINLYEVRITGVNALSQLNLNSLIDFEVKAVAFEKAQRLMEYIGELQNDVLYLLEYPDGYLLSINNEILGFIA
jgi:hypothetical protein